MWDIPKGNVWCAVTKSGVIGPFFFEERCGRELPCHTQHIHEGERTTCYFPARTLSVRRCSCPLQSDGSDGRTTSSINVGLVEVVLSHGQHVHPI
ncbi:hypothetical protein Trydic_g19033 [Trypoxylus dichotomus]